MRPMKIETAMTRTLRHPVSWLALALFAGVIACAPAGEAPPAETAPPVDDEAGVRALCDSWDPTYMSGDADAMTALFVADAVRLPADAPLIRGTDAIRAAFAEDFEGSTYETSNPTDAVGVAGDWAYAYGSWTDKQTSEESGETTEDSGKWLSILRRTDGGWKYAIDMWNRNAPRSSDETEATAAVELPPAEGLTDGPAEDVAAVRATADSWAAAQDAGDVDALVAPYAEDAVSMGEDAPTVTGRDAIRAALESETATTDASDSAATVDAVEVDGDWAWARGHFTTTATPAEGGTAQTVVGKWLNVLERTDDGWKIKVAMWNRDAPPPAS